MSSNLKKILIKLLTPLLFPARVPLSANTSSLGGKVTLSATDLLSNSTAGSNTRPSHKTA